MSRDERFRDRVADAYETHGGAVVGWAEDGSTATGKALDEAVEGVVIDLDTMVEEGAELVDLLRGQRRDLRIVVAAEDLRRFDELLASGFDAWVSRRADAGTLVAALRGVRRADRR